MTDNVVVNVIGHADDDMTQIEVGNEDLARIRMRTHVILWMWNT